MARPSATRLVASWPRTESWICQRCLTRNLQAQRRSIREASTRRTSPKRHNLISAAVPTARRNDRRLFGTSPSHRGESRRSIALPEGPARTRFAPSPTGYLHIGGLRTALFSYLLAKRTGGQFLLRIEDTDQKRLVPGAEERLLEDLRWAGLQWDEGPQVGGPCGPYKQSERNEVYRQHAEELLDNGAAYRCFCKPQTSGQVQAAYVTSGCHQDCSSLPSDEARSRADSDQESFTVRLKPPETGKRRVYPDLVYGKIVPLKRSPAAPTTENAETSIDGADTILVKSDGTPTYHFANVVDDHLMRITHVIRGLEWMASTPLHYDLYQAFGWQPPIFAHVGLLVDQNKAKLSKRNADLALDVRSMREDHGVLPETLVNFLALQGWSNPLQSDVYTLPGLVENFDLKFTKGNTMVRFEKLWYLQKQHVARRCEEMRKTGQNEALMPLVGQLRSEAVTRFPDVKETCTTDQYLLSVLLVDSKSYQNAKQYVERNRYFFAFDPLQVPPLPEAYVSQGRNIQTSAIQGLVERMMKSLGSDWLYDGDKEAKVAPTDALAALEATPQPAADAAAARIHAAIQYETLLDVYQDFTPTSVYEKLHGKYPSIADMLRPVRQGMYPAESVLEMLDNTDTTTLVALGGPGKENEHAKNDLLQARKACQAAVMRYLRDRLSYGLPGPSIGVVMAILGWQECCERLGIKVVEEAEGK